MTKIKDCLSNNKTDYVPIWFMRQAGRHLPEFRDLRKKNKDFMKLCFNSELIKEITLQPINRYNLDAAIIFSDILIIPHVMGQKVSFHSRKGPKLAKFNLEKFLNFNNELISEKIDPLYISIKMTRKELDPQKSLISFVGAPWTLTTYMLNLIENGVLNKEKFKREEKIIGQISEKLLKNIFLHIKNQKKSGCDIVQIFDSWAGILPNDKIEKYCTIPNSRIVEFCKSIDIKTICFPKGINLKYKNFVEKVKPDVISIDYDINPNWAAVNLKEVVIQGGMHPKTLLCHKNKVKQEVDKYLNIFKDRVYIFNLGHGILPETNPQVVDDVINQVRKFK